MKADIIKFGYDKELIEKCFIKGGFDLSLNF